MAHCARLFVSGYDHCYDGWPRIIPINKQTKLKLKENKQTANNEAVVPKYKVNDF